MACDLDDLLINITDFDCIADVATNCTIDMLCPYIREAQETLLANKIGWGLLQDLIDNKDEVGYTDLLCGSNFEYCGKKQKHFGIKRVLVYFSYGLYKYGGNYQDTTYGTVYKVVADSTPVDETILKRLKTENFNVANEYWKYVEMFLCANKETFTEFDSCNCECDCDECGDLGIGKSRKIKGKTFKKYGNVNNNNENRQSVHVNCGCSQ